MYAWLHFEGLYYSTVATGEFPFQIFWMETFQHQLFIKYVYIKNPTSAVI
jgi:hypothetical protein